MIARVDDGEIGIGALREDGSEFVAERRLCAQSEFVTVVLEVPSLDDIGAVIIRNTSRNHVASVVTFQSITLYKRH